MMPLTNEDAALFGFPGRTEIVGDQALGEPDRDDVRDHLTQQLVAAVSKLLLGLDVQQDELAGLIDHHHRVRRRFQQTPVPGFGCLSAGDVTNGGGDQDPLGRLQR